MTSTERRKKILELLINSEEIVNATTMAEMCNVTRQVIVSDIALLRAEGNRIISEKRGYYIDRDSDKLLKEVIICKHNNEKMLDELNCIVDNGGKVLNVIVEHPIYGQISADLRISSRYDASEFDKRVKESNACQLCTLTGGVHIHTIEIPDQETYTRIKKDLKKLNILVE